MLGICKTVIRFFCSDGFPALEDPATGMTVIVLPLTVIWRIEARLAPDL
jgi:hypothetical protein